MGALGGIRIGGVRPVSLVIEARDLRKIYHMGEGRSPCPAESLV